MARAVGKKRRSARAANRRVLWLSAVVVVVMFGFGYVMAQYYDTLCRALGIGGKTDRIEAAAVGAVVDLTRTVTVEFTGQAMAGLPWEFHPSQRKLAVHPGETAHITYYVRNLADESVTGQAAPSVTPGTVGAMFKKIECFCFTQQTLAPREARELPVQFVVDPALPREVHTITLSYGFFNTDQAQAKRFGAEATAQGASAHAH